MENKAVPSRISYLSIAVGAGVLALLPLLVKHGYRLAAHPMWWFTPLTLLFFGFVVWRTRYVGLAASAIRRWSALGLIVLGALAGLAATVAESPDFAHLSLLLLITGWALIRQGIVPWTRVVACCSVLWVGFPMPFALTERITTRLNWEAIKTAGGVLDQLGVKQYTTPTTLDLKTTRIEFAQLLDHAGSLPALMFVTLMIVLFTRHPLLLSVMALLSTIVFNWLGSVLLILLQVWAAQNAATSWDVGWPLYATQLGVFILEFGMVCITLYGLSFLFDAVPVDSARKADKGWHGMYNRIVVWPLNFVAIQDDEAPAYLEDDETESLGKKSGETRARNTPSFNATRAATDPFADQLRWFYPTLGCIALTGVFALLSWLIPPYVVDLKALASSATYMDLTSAPNELADLTLIGPASIAGVDEDTRTVGWNYLLPGGVMTMTVEYPRIGPSVSRNLEGWSQVDVPHAYDVDGWRVLETEFVNSIGNRGYGWNVAFNRGGECYSEGGLVTRMVARVKRSVIGRVLQLSLDDVTYHSRLIAQPQSPLSMQRREELRTAFVTASKAVAQTLSVQGRGQDGN